MKWTLKNGFVWYYKCVSVKHQISDVCKGEKKLKEILKSILAKKLNEINLIISEYSYIVKQQNLYPKQRMQAYLFYKNTNSLNVK